LIFLLNVRLAVLTESMAEIALYQLAAEVMVETEAILGTALAAEELLAIRVTAERGIVGPMALLATAAEAAAARAVGSMVTKKLTVTMIG